MFCLEITSIDIYIYRGKISNNQLDSGFSYSEKTMLIPNIRSYVNIYYELNTILYSKCIERVLQFKIALTISFKIVVFLHLNRNPSTIVIAGKINIHNLTGRVPAKIMLTTILFKIYNPMSTN